MTDLLFHNVRVLTMDAACPEAEAVAVRDGRIVAVGAFDEVAAGLGQRAERVDCQGGVLAPAFIDAHCHLLAYAATLLCADCTAARSIAEIQQAIRTQAERTSGDQWVRAFGYEETRLGEGRHPDRHDLDAAVPGRPVRLIHRSGHASVLNSAALRLLGIDAASEEPPGAAIDRDPSTGEPSGLLLAMEQAIEGAGPPLGYGELADGTREACRRLLANGITCIQDATHTNGRSDWELFEQLIEDGAVTVDVVMMEGIDHLGELPEMSAGGGLRRGAVKIMLHELGDEIVPDEAELARLVAEVHGAGRQVAIHAIGEQAIADAADAIESALRDTPRADHRHRIEHCGLLPEGMAERLVRLGIVVVSQPSFVYERGDRYLALIPEEAQPALYAFRSLRQAGVELAAGSDAPVTRPEPLASIATAIDRRALSGDAVAPDQAVDVLEAFSWWTSAAAHAGFLEHERGSVRPGLRADLLLLPPDALEQSAEALRNVSIRRMWVAGHELDPHTSSPVR
jgi:predicted amidohydrolase YtcJ